MKKEVSVNILTWVEWEVILEWGGYILKLLELGGYILTFLEWGGQYLNMDRMGRSFENGEVIS